MRIDSNQDRDYCKLPRQILKNEWQIPRCSLCKCEEILLVNKFIDAILPH